MTTNGSQNSYRQQQRNQSSFYALARKAIDAQDGLNFAGSPETYSGELPYAYIDYPNQTINKNAHNLISARITQDVSSHLNVHVFTEEEQMEQGRDYCNAIAEFIHAEHPFDEGTQMILEPDETNHFILQVDG